VRELGQAGAAPGGPEVEEDVLPAEVPEPQVSAFEGLHREVRGGLSDPEDLRRVHLERPQVHRPRGATGRLPDAEGGLRSFKVGSRLFDLKDVGYQDAGPFNFDTTLPGNANSGHAYGAELKEAEKRELIEYLRSL
jgi:hypothetical protein